MLRWILVELVVTFALGSIALGQNETVVVRPEPLNEVLVNPGMGITTFQRFNGQALNQGVRWSEEGPTAKHPDPFWAARFSRHVNCLLSLVLE
jgi:hypothetical protein